jgi:hypothetical protein
VVATDAFEETFQVAHGVKTSAYPYTPASKTVTYPVRLVAIYDAAPEEFDAHAEEFTALLRGISIRGQSGVELDFAPVRPAQEAAAPPIVAPPAPPPVAPVATEPAPPPPPAATAAATSGKPLVPPAPAKSAGKKTPAPTSGTDK